MHRFSNGAGRRGRFTPLTPALFKAPLYFLLIAINSFHSVRNLCCVACGSMLLFSSFAKSLGFSAVRMLCSLPVPFLLDAVC